MKANLTDYQSLSIVSPVILILTLTLTIEFGLRWTHFERLLIYLDQNHFTLDSPNFQSNTTSTTAAADHSDASANVGGTQTGDHHLRQRSDTGHGVTDLFHHAKVCCQRCGDPTTGRCSAATAATTTTTTAAAATSTA